MKIVQILGSIVFALAGPCWAGEPTPFDALLMQTLSQAQKEAVTEASEDFVAVLKFKKPIHAKPDEFGFKDGGTYGYDGRGYRIIVWCQAASGRPESKEPLFVYGPDIRLDARLFPGIHAHISKTAFYELNDLIEKLNKEANQALVPTPMSGTPAAGAPVAPATGAAHL